MITQLIWIGWFYSLGVSFTANISHLANKNSIPAAAADNFAAAGKDLLHTLTRLGISNRESAAFLIGLIPLIGFEKLLIYALFQRMMKHNCSISASTHPIHP